ncbi:MAG: Gfo/Idh/MocA family oxidoreductase, partial [Caulobacterales bacterium]|nr:Gfo/Idh/MocA family oxidoreductase [Caulobacterales bacterium]
MPSRRDFMMQTAGAAAFASFAQSAASRAQVSGANDRINVAVMGVRSRGDALVRSFALSPNCRVTGVCDVDSRELARIQGEMAENGWGAPAADADVRRLLEDPDLDALVIAAPDHWHAPATLMALDAGKHVYLEKPCSYDPREGELLVAAQAGAGKVVQMGNQQRSSPETIALIAALREGVIGAPYHVYTWYANNRGSIGNGQTTAPPDWLDWELWQGPAPRAEYQDNLVHYNWHWFWHWGTG